MSREGRESRQGRERVDKGGREWRKEGESRQGRERVEKGGRE